MSSTLKPSHDAGAGRPSGLVAYGVALASAIALLPTFAFAYVGPGLGLGAIGSALSLVGAVLLGIVGFVWYPVKRLLKALKKPKTSDE